MKDQNQYSGSREFTIFIPNLAKPSAFITHNASQPPRDITSGNLSDYTQLPLEPQKAQYYFCNTCSVTCKHALMCNIGGVTLQGVINVWSMFFFYTVVTFTL